MQTVTVTADRLQAIQALKEVPLDQLQWVIDNSELVFWPQGEMIMKTGDPLKGMFIVLEGRIRVYMIQHNEMVDITYLEPGSISGYLPFSRAIKVNANAKVIQDVTLLRLPMEKFREMVGRNFELTQALVHIMTTRVRDFTSLQQQNEKMMALGKLSAGLAHELNNPAAAIVRGAESLKKHLQLEPESFKKVIAIQMGEQEIDRVVVMVRNILERTDKPHLTLMERTEKEDELRDWLEEQDVENSADLAETFVDYAFKCEDLEDFINHMPRQHLSPVLNWVNTNLVTERMVKDIQESSQRISDLVKSIKNFTHMDQGKGKESVDIHTGIRNTLIMLNYRFRKGNIELVEEYDLTLPPIMAMVGELNQVWTNLIDNALDAMEEKGKGKLIIRTGRDQEFVKVTITDDGPGIPAEVQSQIFDPFFTTKDIGKGTGLGLDVVNRIVRQQHHGSVKMQSVPGCTSFIVCFPIKG